VGIAISDVRFQGGVEPPRREWFLGATAPGSALSDLDDANVKIVSPAPDTIVAVDPDVPSSEQRIAFEASAAPLDSRWVLDGHFLGAVHGVLLWAPSAGVHTLSIVRESGTALDKIRFSVRGSDQHTFAQDDRNDDRQLQ
jgi:penicillin-binding protein 1C